jgi:Flp pilus assembly protein TadB
MAQTRRKRQTKHRGNAAGVVESRGRTGRKPTAAEKSGDARDLAREKEKLLDKRDRPPTWRVAFVKSMFAAIAFLLLFALVLGRAEQGIKFFPFALLFYTPISYYTDKWVYDRRQRKKAKQGGGGRAPSR